MGKVADTNIHGYPQKMYSTQIKEYEELLAWKYARTLIKEFIVKVKVTQSYSTLCDPVEYTVHGILQARIVEWVAFPSPGDFPNLGIKPQIPIIPKPLLLIFGIDA